MRNVLVSAIAVSLLAGALSPAYASDRHDRGSRHERHWDDRGRDRGYDRYDRRDYRSDHRRWDGRNYDRRYARDDRRFYPSYRYDYSRRFYGGAYYRPSGYRYYSWRRGDRLPLAYYAPRYVIRDYRPYRLYAPPRGYHWVRVNDDVVLAAITTGIVLGVVNNIFY
jgi:Ni/Co efflux regulator RcnB